MPSKKTPKTEKIGTKAVFHKRPDGSSFKTTAPSTNHNPAPAPVPSTTNY